MGKGNFTMKDKKKLTIMILSILLVMMIGLWASATSSYGNAITELDKTKEELAQYKERYSVLDDKYTELLDDYIDIKTVEDTETTLSSFAGSAAMPAINHYEKCFLSYDRDMDNIGWYGCTDGKCALLRMDTPGLGINPVLDEEEVKNNAKENEKKIVYIKGEE